MKIGDQKFQILIEKKDIEKRIHKLAKKIQHDFHGEELIIVCVLKGAFIFCADLVRQFEDFKCRVDFVQLSSYSDGMTSSGKINLIKDLEIDIKGKNVLIVDDILDTGLSLDYLVKHLKEREPKNIKTCVLLDKPSRRKFDVKSDYIGFEIENEFVVGAGLDYNEHYRNLRDIFIIEEF